MKILTLNTWQESGDWQKRWEVTLEGLRRLKPEIAVFQELFSRTWAAEVQKQSGFGTLLFPKEPCGLVLYANVSAPTWGVIRLAQSPLEEYGRYAMWAELKMKGGALTVFNTHLSWKPEDGETRGKQVRELLQLVQEKAEGTESILTGDLNAPPTSPEIQWFLHEGKFRDLFEVAHPGEAGFSWDNRNPYAGGSHHKLPDRRIDYILTRGPGPLLKDYASCNLVFTQPNPKGIWASDHYGLLAEFK